LKGLVDGNYRVEIYIHLLDLTRNSCEKCNFRFLAGIEPQQPSVAQLVRALQIKSDRLACDQALYVILTTVSLGDSHQKVTIFDITG
jgi:hypothetical protein